MIKIRGGKWLTADQTMRLAVASSVDREKLLKVIVDEMRAKEQTNERRTAHVRQGVTP